MQGMKFQLILLFGDVLCVSMASSLTYFLLSDFSSDNWFESYLGVVLVSLLIGSSISFCYYLLGLYDIRILRSRKELFVLILFGLFICSLVINPFLPPSLNITYNSWSYPIFISLALLFTNTWRGVYLKYTRDNPQKMLIIGADHRTRDFVSDILEHPFHNFSKIFIYDQGKIDMHDTLYQLNGGSAVIQQIDDLESYVRRNNVSPVIISDVTTIPKKDFEKLYSYSVSGHQVLDISSSYRRFLGKIPIDQEESELPSILTRNSHLSPRVYMRLKRTIDIVFSFVGLVFTFPLLSIVAIVIKCESRGSIIYKQVRLGLNRRDFTLYKLRTMMEKAETATGPVWANENDPRITRVGSFLRKTHIDEIPQLFNVLKGDLSLVGPRPIRRIFEQGQEMITSLYWLRHSVKPGITGWAQVNFDGHRDEGGPIERFKYDLYYIENYSIFMDIFILLKTIQKVLKGSSV